MTLTVTINNGLSIVGVKKGMNGKQKENTLLLLF